MEFTQSRYQYIFSNLYMTFCDMIWHLVIAVFFAVTFSESVNFTFVLLGAVFFSGAIVWYMFSKSVPKDLHLYLGDDCLRYKNKNVITEYSWDKYIDYKVSRFIPAKIVINDSVYGSTRICYYAFDKKQRQQIFEILNSKTKKVTDNSLS